MWVGWSKAAGARMETAGMIAATDSLATATAAERRRIADVMEVRTSVALSE